jgi:hypothetical protein
MICELILIEFKKWLTNDSGYSKLLLLKVRKKLSQKSNETLAYHLNDILNYMVIVVVVMMMMMMMMTRRMMMMMMILNY